MKRESFVSLKDKTIAGMKWSFIDRFTNQGIQFVIGLILARLLNPREWGLIGMLTFFIAISQSFVDSGFSSALIRKKDCADQDYSTVFIFNLAIGVLFYLFLFAAAGPISRFYGEPRLVPLLRVLGLVILIGSPSIIQNAILVRAIAFRLLARISILSSLISGAISIFLALRGFGVWSLAARLIAQSAAVTLLLWLWVGWRPRVSFNGASFRELFHFGNKLFLSNLINAGFQNIYYLVIGRYFSATDLGYYSRADQFKNLPSTSMASVIQRVSFPVLATIQDDTAQLKSAYKKLIQCTMFISFALMFVMAAVARSMIHALIGPRWLPAVPYLQLLCFAAMLYPLHSLNLNMLQVKGRSDLFLAVEIIKKLIAIIPIAIGIFLGIQAMIIGMIVTSVVAYIPNSFFSARLIGYSPREQIMDILPSFAIAGVSGAIAYAVGRLLALPSAFLLVLQLGVAISLIIIISATARLHAYLEVKGIIADNIKAWRRRDIRVKSHGNDPE